MKTQTQLDKEVIAATQTISGLVRQLLDDGTENASLVMALSAALGVMLASAPAHMDRAVEAVALRQLRECRDETRDEINAAAH